MEMWFQKSGCVTSTSSSEKGEFCDVSNTQFHTVAYRTLVRNGLTTARKGCPHCISTFGVM